MLQTSEEQLLSNAHNIVLLCCSIAYSGLWNTGTDDITECVLGAAPYPNYQAWMLHNSRVVSTSSSLVHITARTRVWNQWLWWVKICSKRSSAYLATLHALCHHSYITYNVLERVARVKPRITRWPDDVIMTTFGDSVLERTDRRTQQAQFQAFNCCFSKNTLQIINAWAAPPLLSTVLISCYITVRTVMSLQGINVACRGMSCFSSVFATVYSPLVWSL